MQTEARNPRTETIDQLDTLALVRRIHEEDRAVAEAIQTALPQVSAAIDAIVERVRVGGRLFYVGAGTSGRLGVLDAVECVPTFGTPPQMVQGIIAGGAAALTRAVEGVEDDWNAGASDLAAHGLSTVDAVVGIAASGRTPYVLGALAYARQVGALTVGVSNNQPSAVLDAAELPIAVVTGPEVISGSTRLKAGTAQKQVLNMLSTGTMIRLGKVYGNLMVDVQVTNAKLQQRAVGIVQLLTDVDAARAAFLLRAADGSAKLAIVMARLGLNAADARARLDAAEGVLRRVIG